MISCVMIFCNMMSVTEVVCVVGRRLLDFLDDDLKKARMRSVGREVVLANGLHLG